MFKLLQKHKFLLAGLMVAGTLFLVASHSIAMPNHMDPTKCEVQNVCGVCAVPIFQGSPELDYSPSFLNNIFEIPAYFPEVNAIPLYHPPR